MMETPQDHFRPRTIREAVEALRPAYDEDPATGVPLKKKLDGLWDQYAMLKKEEETLEEEGDAVRRPSHYNQYTGFEVMDVCRQLVSPDATPASTWFRANAFKYLARAGWKNPAKELEDLQKAAEYLRLEIERVATRDDFVAEMEMTPAADTAEDHSCPMCFRLLDPSGACPVGHSDTDRVKEYVKCPQCTSYAQKLWEKKNMYRCNDCGTELYFSVPS